MRHGNVIGCWAVPSLLVIHRNPIPLKAPARPTPRIILHLTHDQFPAPPPAGGSRRGDLHPALGAALRLGIDVVGQAQRGPRTVNMLAELAIPPIDFRACCANAPRSAGTSNSHRPHARSRRATAQGARRQDLFAAPPRRFARCARAFRRRKDLFAARAHEGCSPGTRVRPPPMRVSALRRRVPGGRR